MLPKGLGHNTGPSAIPRKFSANTGNYKLVARIAKSTTSPAHVNRSHCFDQAITHPLKKRGTSRFSNGSMGSIDPHKQPPNQSRPSVIRLAMWSLAAPHPRCKPQTTGARQSSHRVSGSQESRITSLNSVSTDNPKSWVHGSAYARKI